MNNEDPTAFLEPQTVERVIAEDGVNRSALYGYIIYITLVSIAGENQETAHINLDAVVPNALYAGDEIQITYKEVQTREGETRYLNVSKITIVRRD